MASRCPEGAIRTAKTRAMLADDSAAAVAGGAGADRGRVSDDRRDRSRGPAAQARAATLRCPSARVPGVGRRAVRDRRVDRGGGVVRARRLPTLPPFRTSGAPHRPGRDRRLVGSSTRRRVPLTPGTRRRCAGRSTKQPRTPRITAVPTTSTTPQVKERHDGKIAAISVARQLARRCYHVLRNLDPDVVYAMPT